MRRTATARVLAGVGLAVVLAAGSSAAEDAGPALTPPSVVGPVVDPDPPGELPKDLRSRPIPGNAPVLVVPGMNVPRNGLRPRTPASTPATAPVPGPIPQPDNDLPPIVGPSEMSAPAPPTSRDFRPRGPSGPPPIVLESEPLGTDPDGRSIDLDHRPPATRPRATSPTPRRSSGLFGRFFPSAPTVRDAPDAGDLGKVKVEPRTDPADDAALKRRVERQIREKVGTRLRSWEVRVVDREVTIFARAARFWQRRAARNALESLPALNGLKATIEVVD